MRSDDGPAGLDPMDWLTTDQLVEEMCRRYPHVLLIYTREASPDEEGSLVIHTSAADSAGCAIGLGMSRAASLFMENRLSHGPDDL
jgi:hypothetical protein